MHRLTPLIIAAAAVCLPSLAAAQNLGIAMPMCQSPHLTFAAAPKLPPDLAPSPNTRVWADRAESSGQQSFEFRGDVQVVRDGESLSADEASYDKKSEVVDARGDVRLHQDGLTAQGTHAYFNLQRDAGTLDDAKYQYDANHAHGRASRIIIESSDVTRLKKATLTTCDPEDVVWELDAGDVRLDKISGRGRALNVIFRIKHIPLLYLPYMSFPISDKRKSGVLIPSIATSSRSGSIVAIPYYFNIAPNLDATLTPRLMTKRGLQYEGQLRYLTHASHGEINAQYLPNDRVYGGGRAELFATHVSNFTPHLYGDWLINYVSDKYYLQDFGSSLATTSTNYLDNHADLTYRRDSGYITGRVQAYQNVDPALSAASLPYQELPQILFDYNPLLATGTISQDYDAAGEFVRFKRSGRPSVDRLNVRPSMSFSFEREAGFIIPRLTLSHARYLLQNQPAGSPTQLTRTLPISSLDTGIFLERDLNFGTHHWIQTLEPRAFYVYIPYKDQSQLPVFDTGQPDLNMIQLFNENRFSGPDRIGDANQVSLALTTRFLRAATGREMLSMAVGQIVYFRDRKVTLPGQLVDRDKLSDTVAETTASVSDHVSAIGDLLWSHKTHDIDRGTFALRYRSDRYHIINLSYRFVRSENIRQTDIAAVWPVTRRWRLVGRWNYSLHDRRSLETLAGVEYDSCCWGFRVAWRRFISSINAGSNSSVLFQAVFKGMTSVGSPVETLLERGILGTQSTL